MNRTFSKLVKMMCMAGVLVMAACSSDDGGTTAVTVRVKVNMPTGFSADAVYAGHEVTLGRYIATTDASGVATFAGVIPDVYDLSTSCDITAEEYRTLTGDTESQNGSYVISGALLNQTIAADMEIALPTTVAVKPSIVISKVRYQATKDNNNKNYFAGKYIELFNNSDEAINIAGLYIGLVESEGTAPAYALGATPEYIYLKQVFRIPADQEKTVAAGASVLIANSAIDHTQSNDIDLSGADFEAKDEQGKTTNNPDVPAIELVYSNTNISNMNLTQGGPCSVVLFQTDEDLDNWETVHKQGASSGNMYLKTPVKYVTDGIDCLKKNSSTGAADVNSKRLYDYIDAGYQNVEGTNAYTAEVIYRKVSQTENGRTVLADTNNSSNDFAVASDIKPREYR